MLGLSKNLADGRLARCDDPVTMWQPLAPMQVIPSLVLSLACICFVDPHVVYRFVSRDAAGYRFGLAVAWAGAAAGYFAIGLAACRVSVRRRPGWRFITTVLLTRYPRQAMAIVFFGRSLLLSGQEVFAGMSLLALLTGRSWDPESVKSIIICSVWVLLVAGLHLLCALGGLRDQNPNLHWRDK